MQTFVTRVGAYQTAKDLDGSRLGKQRIEAFQILQSLLGINSGWASHPAVRMWKGHEYGLAIYTLCICHEWQRRGYNDSVELKVKTYLSSRPQEFVAMVRSDKVFWETMPIARELAGPGSRIWPWWMSDRDVLRSHRSNLLRKNPSIYEAKFPGQVGTWPYLWPDPAIPGLVRISKAEVARLDAGERIVPPGMEIDWTTLEVIRG